MSCTRLESGTAITPGRFGGTCGRSVGGFGPTAFQEPKYFSMVDRACCGVTFPITTMVVRSGRNVLR